MKPATLASSADTDRKITIRIPEAQYAAFAAIARMAEHSPSAFLRQLVDRAVASEQALPAGPYNGHIEAVVTARLDHLADGIVQNQLQLARLERLLGQTGTDTPTQIQLLDGLLRKTLVQAVAGSYVSIQMWRMLADESQRPQNGLPPSMLADIQELARRITAAAEAEARS